MGKILESLFGKGSSAPSESDYMELDLESYEVAAGEDSPATMYVKIANINDIKDTPRVKDEIYNGNIVVADIGRLRTDKVACERVLRDLRDVAADVNGDIVGLGDQKYVVITPMSVKISRDKIGGSR